jgi:hypothetical protein
MVGEYYRNISIKSTESGWQTNGQEIENIKIYGGSQKIPKEWGSFLSSGLNKNALQQFLYEKFSNTFCNHTSLCV